jgi:hypothetical protein
VTAIYFSCQVTKAFWYRLLNDMLLPDMPIGFNPVDVPARDEDVGGGPYFGYCNVPKLTSNLPLPDLWGVNPLTCGLDCTPFSETDHRKDQAIFLGRPTGKQTRGATWVWSYMDSSCAERHLSIHSMHRNPFAWTLFITLILRNS